MTIQSETIMLKKNYPEQVSIKLFLPISSSPKAMVVTYF